MSANPLSSITGVGDVNVGSIVCGIPGREYGNQEKQFKSTPFFKRSITILFFFLPLIAYWCGIGICLIIIEYYKNKDPTYIFGLNAMFHISRNPLYMNFDFWYYWFIPMWAILQGMILVVVLQYYWVSTSDAVVLNDVETRNMLYIYLTYLLVMLLYHMTALLYGWGAGVFVPVFVAYSYIIQLFRNAQVMNWGFFVLMLFELIFITIEVNRVQLSLNAYDQIMAAELAQNLPK